MQPCRLHAMMRVGAPCETELCRIYERQSTSSSDLFGMFAGVAADDGEEGLPSDALEEEDDGDGPTAMLLAPEEAVEVARGEEGDDDEADDGDDPFGHKKRKRKKESEAQLAVRRMAHMPSGEE